MVVLIMTAAQIRALADELTQIGKNYKGFTCINEMVTKALVLALQADLLERKEQAAMLDRIAAEINSSVSASELRELASKLREQ